MLNVYYLFSTQSLYNCIYIYLFFQNDVGLFISKILYIIYSFGAQTHKHLSYIHTRFSIDLLFTTSAFGIEKNRYWSSYVKWCVRLASHLITVPDLESFCVQFIKSNLKQSRKVIRKKNIIWDWRGDMNMSLKQS